MTHLDKLYNEWKALQPLKEDDQKRLSQKFMLEFNYNSNHIEGNTLTYGQTEMLLLFGRVVDAANMKDLEDMKASNVGLKMMSEASQDGFPLTETFIRQLHHTLLREDYTVWRQLPGGKQTSYVVHAGVYKTRPNSVITQTGERFEYASPEETPALMYDLVSWYNENESRLSPIELASLFHYRYIRIHPFEDGNGRIARLMVNFILSRKGYPMLVVKSKDKENYLKALEQCDAVIGPVPSAGAHAELTQIAPFVEYMKGCLLRALTVSIKAAKGESIEEDDDFMKDLRILELQKKQEEASRSSAKTFCNEEFWNVMEFVYFPLAKGFETALKTVNDVFRFSHTEWGNFLSKTQELTLPLNVNQVLRQTTDSQLLAYIREAKSIWFRCKLQSPQQPVASDIAIEKRFYIQFFEDHYFVDGIMNKNFAYGTYPAEQDKEQIAAHFKKEILKELKEKL